jgi:hypothetical protein
VESASETHITLWCARRTPQRDIDLPWSSEEQK